MSERDALTAGPNRALHPTRAAGRRFLVGYGIILTLAGLILADEPDHSRAWRSLGIVAAVIGLACVVAPLARRRRQPEPDATAGPGAPDVRTESPAVGPLGVDEKARSARHAELDRRATQLAAAQVRLDLAATDLAIEQGRLDERNAALLVEQTKLDEQVADLAARRHAVHGG
jgi:hypothetical protein